ncbi:MAG TPA: long-chain fatty acid--CoA ligase [Thermoanaerobaculaceae bacterium]|nr:long-chain fatty acid--CoA ligase [Thermoanaerobaculaceae bacterium]
MGEPRTLLNFFALWRGASPTPALVDVRGGGEIALQAPEVARRVAGLAKGLAAIGVGKGDRVGLLCGDRPEWHIVDFACLHLGALDVPIYPTLLATQVRAILTDSGARIVVAENPEQLAKVLEVRGSCPQLRDVLLIDGNAPPGVRTLGSCTAELTQSEAEAFLESCRPHVQPGDLATLIYTSGTTGEPKGVMLTHDNFVFDAGSSASVMPWPGGETALAFLPLSHVLERLVDYTYFMHGLTIAYCGILETADAMRRVRPDVFTAVPRFYEKVYERVMHEVAQGPKLKQSLFRAALRVGIESVRTGRKGFRYRFFDLLVYSKIRAALGGRILFSISGGAPLPVFIGEFFHAMGIKALEGYGLTETSPVITVNHFDRWKLGTVGPPVPGAEVRIAPDGEVLTRGRHVMKGYWNKPEETAAVLDSEGWLATGDIGDLDSDGFLRITDRKKDILVTAGGKNVAPQPIETQLNASPLVENSVLFGDRKPYIVALIVPNFEALDVWATKRGVPAGDRVALLTRPDVLAAYQEMVDGVNANLARYETIKRFRLIAEPFTISGGQLTPTLKVKRRVIEERFALLLSAMYGEGASTG